VLELAFEWADRVASVSLNAFCGWRIIVRRALLRSSTLVLFYSAIGTGSWCSSLGALDHNIV
jgi:hypothetical protein